MQSLQKKCVIFVIALHTVRSLNGFNFLCSMRATTGAQLLQMNLLFNNSIWMFWILLFFFEYYTRWDPALYSWSVKSPRTFTKWWFSNSNENVMVVGILLIHAVHIYQTLGWWKRACFSVVSINSYKNTQFICPALSIDKCSLFADWNHTESISLVYQLIFCSAQWERNSRC